MISLLADRIDSSSAAALQGVGKSALRDMRERSVNRRDGGGEGEGCRVMERERVRFVLIPLTVSTIVIELSNVFYMYACIYYYSDNFLTRDYSIKLKSKWCLGSRLIPNDFHYGH